MSDFDMDGLTALQEYELSQSTSGQFGNHLGKFKLLPVPYPPGFKTNAAGLPMISSSGGMELIESAKNGTSLFRITGIATGQTTSTTRIFTYAPATQAWCIVTPPASYGTATILPADINSRGQVVGSLRIGSIYKGFCWTPDPTHPAGGASQEFLLNTSSPTPAMPRRISDTGYMIQGTAPGSVTLQITVNGVVRATDTLEVRRMDLDVDSDNSGTVTTSETEEEIESDAREPGKILLGNRAAESDANGIPLHPGELAGLKLQTANLQADGTVSLSYPADLIRVWKKPPGQTPGASDLLAPGQTFSPGSNAEFSIQSLGKGAGLVRIRVASGEVADEVLVHLTSVEVVPDDDQPGKTGDQIPSNKGETGEKHYVSPKKGEEIPDGFVVLKAKGIDKELFDKLLEWECDPTANGSVHPDDSTKYRVKRDASGKTVVKIKTKDGGQEVDLMNVWIVWADTEIVQSLQNPIFGAGVYSGGGAGDPARAWQFKFKIKPVELFSLDPAADLPKLGGNANSDPPGHGIRYFFTKHLNFPDEFGDTASLRWDVSRQVEIKVFNNPSGAQVPLAKFVDSYSFLKVGQPAAQTTPVSYPADAAQGNDDPVKKKGLPIKDEDSNPYRAISENNGLSHGIGEITSFDAPIFTPFVNEPAPGSAMVQIANFREFARLEIKGGGTNQQNLTYWYRISDYIDWHHVWAAIYGEKPSNSGNFAWLDAGSSSKKDIYEVPNE